MWESLLEYIQYLEPFYPFIVGFAGGGMYSLIGFEENVLEGNTEKKGRVTSSVSFDLKRFLKTALGVGLLLQALVMLNLSMEELQAILASLGIAGAGKKLLTIAGLLKSKVIEGRK